MTPDAGLGASPPVTLRRAAPEDLPVLAELCRRAIMATGSAGYTPAQVEAWASFTRDVDAFRDFILYNRTWVAEVEGEAAGFGGLGPGGYVASLYVAPDRGRRGLATAILRHLLATGRREGIRRFHAAASRISLPVFLRAGFSVSEEEVVEREGIPLLRYRVALEDASA